jgi:hypothetical protein
LEEKLARIDAEKAALRRIEVTGGDEVALGCKSSGWPEFKELLKAKLLFLRKARIGRADEAAAALNRMGFKTGSGQRWTPRLINIAKMKLFVATSVQDTARAAHARDAAAGGAPTATGKRTCITLIRNNGEQSGRN